MTRRKSPPKHKSGCCEGRKCQNSSPTTARLSILSFDEREKGRWSWQSTHNAFESARSGLKWNNFSLLFPHIISAWTSTLERSHSTLTQFSLSVVQKNFVQSHFHCSRFSRKTHIFFLLFQLEYLSLRRSALLVCVCDISFASAQFSVYTTTHRLEQAEQHYRVYAQLHIFILYFFRTKSHSQWDPFCSRNVEQMEKLYSIQPR